MPFSHPFSANWQIICPGFNEAPKEVQEIIVSNIYNASRFMNFYLDHPSIEDPKKLMEDQPLQLLCVELLAGYLQDRSPTANHPLTFTLPAATASNALALLMNNLVESMFTNFGITPEMYLEAVKNEQLFRNDDPSVSNSVVIIGAAAFAMAFAATLADFVRTYTSADAGTVPPSANLH